MKASRKRERSTATILQLLNIEHNSFSVGLCLPTSYSVGVGQPDYRENVTL